MAMHDCKADLRLQASTRSPATRFLVVSTHRPDEPPEVPDTPCKTRRILQGASAAVVRLVAQEAARHLMDWLFTGGWW